MTAAVVNSNHNNYVCPSVKPTNTDLAECPICGTVVEAFLPYSPNKPDRRCPTCGSMGRHRAVWLYFQQRTNLFTDELHILHLAPEPSLGPRLAALPNLDYVSADLDSPRAMVHMDITNMPYPNGSFDVIYASHVLEHIVDDRRAMSEVNRVLRRGGFAVLLVPMFHNFTREDPTVVDPAERQRLFGQHDHVRMYGHDGEFEQRLHDAGFEVTVLPVDNLDGALVRRYRMDTTDIIHVCRKHGVAAV